MKWRVFFSRYLRLLLLIIIAVSVCIASVVVLYVIPFPFRAFPIVLESQSADYLLTPPPPLPTAVPTATPSPTLTPTPVYTGYCMQVPVLMYHHIQPWEIAKRNEQTALTVDNGVFALQMQYLTEKGYTFYFAEDLIAALREKKPLSGKPIVITIDDGYNDIYQYAFPVIKQFSVKANLFIPTGLVGNTAGTNSYLSWDQITSMLGSGIVRANNHTWSHAAMGGKNDAYEISTAQTQLSSFASVTNTVFSFPFGTNSGNSSVHTLLAQNGITGGFSTIAGTTQCDSFIFGLHRTRVGSAPFPAFGIY